MPVKLYLKRQKKINLLQNTARKNPFIDGRVYYRNNEKFVDDEIWYEYGEALGQIGFNAAKQSDYVTAWAALDCLCQLGGYYAKARRQNYNQNESLIIDKLNYLGTDLDIIYDGIHSISKSIYDEASKNKNKITICDIFSNYHNLVMEQKEVSAEISKSQKAYLVTLHSVFYVREYFKEISKDKFIKENCLQRIIEILLDIFSLLVEDELFLLPDSIEMISMICTLDSEQNNSRISSAIKNLSERIETCLKEENFSKDFLEKLLSHLSEIKVSNEFLTEIKEKIRRKLQRI